MDNTRITDKTKKELKWAFRMNSHIQQSKYKDYVYDSTDYRTFNIAEMYENEALELIKELLQYKTLTLDKKQVREVVDLSLRSVYLYKVTLKDEEVWGEKIHYVLAKSKNTITKMQFDSMLFNYASIEKIEKLSFIVDSRSICNSKIII
jgi:hypothetical protein